MNILLFFLLFLASMTSFIPLFKNGKEGVMYSTILALFLFSIYLLFDHKDETEKFWFEVSNNRKCPDRFCAKQI
jgi:hypothetical protein